MRRSRPHWRVLAVSSLAHRRIFGLDFVDADSVDDVVDAVLAFDTTAAIQPLVITPNLDHLVQLQDASPEIGRPTSSAAFVLPDGQPIVWASRWFGDPLSARLTGSDLFASLFGRVEDGSVPLADVMVIAPSEQVAEGLEQRHPGIAVLVAPFLDVEDVDGRREFADEVVVELGAARPGHVFVCISQPKQLLLSMNLMAVWPDGPLPLFYCVGASPEMYLGLEKRAPAWMQRIGAEFVYRAMRDPSKIKRYWRDLLGFPKLLLAERRARRSSNASA